MTHQQGSCDLYSTDDQRYYCTIQTSLGCVQCQSLHKSISYSDGRQLAAAAGGEHRLSWLFLKPSRVSFEKRRGRSPDLPWVSLMNHSHCVLHFNHSTRIKNACKMEESRLPSVLHKTLRLWSDPAIWSPSAMVWCIASQLWPWGDLDSHPQLHPPPPSMWQQYGRASVPRGGRSSR